MRILTATISFPTVIPQNDRIAPLCFLVITRTHPQPWKPLSVVTVFLLACAHFTPCPAGAWSCARVWASSPLPTQTASCTCGPCLIWRGVGAPQPPLGSSLYKHSPTALLPSYRLACLLEGPQLSVVLHHVHHCVTRLFLVWTHQLAQDLVQV